MLSNILKLVKKEVMLEWRQKTALGTIFIYVLGTTFLIYLIFQKRNGLRTTSKLFFFVLLLLTWQRTARCILRHLRAIMCARNDARRPAQRQVCAVLE